VALIALTIAFSVPAVRRGVARLTARLTGRPGPTGEPK
jgi:hypothetical protein